VVHASGRLETVADPVETRRILDALVSRFEAFRDPPWQFAMAERERDAFVNAIVGFRMRIRRLSAKLKLSQNRPGPDQVRVAAALEREDHPDAGHVAAWMREYGAAGKHRDRS
jgi:transcriptional regulator